MGPGLPAKIDFSLIEKQVPRRTLAIRANGLYLLNYWATWCTPCLLELAALERLAVVNTKAAPTVIAISVDRPGTSRIAEVFNRLRLSNLPSVFDPTRSTLAQSPLPSLPFTALVRRDGTVVACRRGRVDWDAPDERAALARMVAAARNSASLDPPVRASATPDAATQG